MIGDVICLLILWSFCGQTLVNGQCTAVECAGDSTSNSDGHIYLETADYNNDENMECRSELEEPKLKTQVMTEQLERLAARIEQNSITQSQLNNTLQSQIQQLKLQINASSSRMDAFGSQIRVVQSQVTSLSSVPAVTRCRLCFREIEGSSQCQRSRSSCSGWSNSPSWTSPFRDDTDGRDVGCTYQWRLECA